MARATAAAAAGAPSPLERLDADCLREVLARAGPRAVGAFAATCTRGRDAAGDARLWERCADLQFAWLPEEMRATAARSVAEAGGAERPEGEAGGAFQSAAESAPWIELCRRGDALRDAGGIRARWHRPRSCQSGARAAGGQTPSRREGHAAVNLDGVAVVLGGFTDFGIRADVHVLDLRRAAPTPGRHREFERAWHQVTLPQRGNANAVTPRNVYGHSAVTLRLADGSSVVVRFGGMRGGGYSGEVDDLEALRWATESHAPPPPPEGGQHASLSHYPLEFFEICARPDEVHGWPPARGYHAACADDSGRVMYVSGGIAEGASLACNDLWALDVGAESGVWQWRRLVGDAGSEVAGEVPPARFGHSMCVTSSGRVLLVGGGNGGDLLREGGDLHDAWLFDLAESRWHPASIGPNAERQLPPRVGGRCHAAVQLPCTQPDGGERARMLLVGGGLESSGRVHVLEFRIGPALGVGEGLEVACRVCVVENAVLAKEPPHDERPAPQAVHPRLSPALALLGGHRLVLFGGWAYDLRAMGDTMLAELAPLDTPNDRRREYRELTRARVPDWCGAFGVDSGVGDAESSGRSDSDYGDGDLSDSDGDGPAGGGGIEVGQIIQHLIDMGYIQYGPDDDSDDGASSGAEDGADNASEGGASGSGAEDA